MLESQEVPLRVSALIRRRGDDFANLARSARELDDWVRAIYAIPHGEHFVVGDHALGLHHSRIQPSALNEPRFHRSITLPNLRLSQIRGRWMRDKF
jgi:hypothetical protein